VGRTVTAAMTMGSMVDLMAVLYGVLEMAIKFVEGLTLTASIESQVENDDALTEKQIHGQMLCLFFITDTNH